MQPPTLRTVPTQRRGEIRLDDRELIRRIKNGEESALSALMLQYRRPVFSAAFRVLRLQPDAQEVSQDVFWALWRSPDRFDTARGNLLSWLVILSRSRALDVLRRIRSHSAHLHEIDLPHWGEAADQPESWDLELRREEILDRLPREQRWIIRKIYFEGFTFAEAAALRATPLGTLKNRARGALKKLRVEFGNADLAVTPMAGAKIFENSALPRHYITRKIRISDLP